MRALALVALVALAGCAELPATPVPVDPGPPFECTGISAATCQQIVDDARRDAEPGTVPVRIRAACTRVCTPQAGDVSVEVVYSNGRTNQYGMGWAGAVPAGPPVADPPLPVQPVCQGIAPEPCRAQAEDAWQSQLARADVVSIVVRCTAVCGPNEGTGTTIVTFADGTTVAGDWGYASGG